MKKYFEEKINFDQYEDKYVVAAKIADLKADNEYLLYENKSEISLGIGIYGMVKADTKFTTVEIQDKSLKLENKDLSETLNNAFNQIEIQDWRAYGIIKFGLARYNNNLPLLNEDERIITAFIPEAEVRVYDDSIVVRALEEEKLNQLKNMVQDIIAQNDDNKFKERISKEKLNVPEIFTYDAEKIGRAHV